MLKFLHIENIAVIEHSEIEFTDGFNVLTGETGAGKSIIIDSLNAVLGERTSKDLIREGCDFAEVSALFGNLSDETVSKLAERDIFPDEDGNLLIVRKLSNSGKGFIKINGKLTTAGILKEIAVLLINIHGQHDNQDLLNPEKHCDYLDAVADNYEIISRYYDEFKNLNLIRRELNEIETDQEEKQHKIDLYKYQISEIEAANFNVGEVAKLKEQLKIAENHENATKALNTALNLIYGDNDFDGAITLLKNASKQLSGLQNNIWEEKAVTLNDIIVVISDISGDISQFLNSADFADINADEINQRLDLLYKLMLKYGSDEQAVLDYYEKICKELESIEFRDKKVAELSSQLENSKELLIELGNELSESRKNAAEKFSVEVCDVLQYLNMPSVKFAADIKQSRYTKRGCDNVEFLISTNAGESMKPLHKIASGGELSRIMLAIKSCLLDKDCIGTMIFDEIDTGISGYAADKVGAQLKKVSDNRQVICVTHLAQIAAVADNHLLIEKSTVAGKTFTNVSSLEYEGRIEEIARIMSGTEITENLYNSAKELLDRSYKK